MKWDTPPNEFELAALRQKLKFILSDLHDVEAFAPTMIRCGRCTHLVADGYICQHCGFDPTA